MNIFLIFLKLSRYHLAIQYVLAVVWNSTDLETNIFFVNLALNITTHFLND